MIAYVKRSGTRGTGGITLPLGVLDLAWNGVQRFGWGLWLAWSRDARGGFAVKVLYMRYVSAAQ